MRNVLIDETAIRAKEARQMHLRIVDQQRQTLADEVLGQQHQRAFAQIVGPGLERQADHADPALARRHHLRDRMIDMRAVRGHDAPMHRQLDVAHLGQVVRGAQILRQARSAEREARPQIRRRDVELAVAADEIHHLERVDAHRLADPGRLVRESDLEGVEVVAAVFDHLGGADGRRDELARQVPEEIAQPGDRSFGIRADDGERRLVVVAYRRPLAQELGLEADVEVDAVLLAGLGLDDRAQHVLDGAGDERRAKHENVGRGLVAHRRPEVFRDLEHRRLVLAPIGRRRRADAHERDLALQDRPCAYRG